MCRQVGGVVNRTFTRGRGLSAVILLTLAATVPTISASTATAATDKPIAFTVALPASLISSDVLVEAVPTTEAVEASPTNFTYVIPQSDVTSQAGRLLVAVDPKALPAKYISDLGRVNFAVSAVDAQNFYGTILTSQAVSDPTSGIVSWVDPEDITDVVPSAFTTINDRVPVVKLSQTLLKGGPPSIDDLTKASRPAPSDDDSEFPTDPSYRSSKCPDGGSGPHAIDKVDEYILPATIGTTYPIGNSVAWMTTSSADGNGASYGAAMRYAGSGIQADSSTFADGSWGKSWLKSADSRSYQANVKYVDMWFHGYLNPDCDHHHYYAIKETGGTGENAGIERPTTWDKKWCQPTSPGPFWRTSGKKYEYGAAIKADAGLGLDLGIRRSYTTSQRTDYTIRGSNKSLCGNNDYPSNSGKLMERWLSAVQ